MCVEEVRSALKGVKTVQGLKLQLSPPIAEFKLNTDQVSMQDVVLAIRKAGGAFDAKLLLHEDPKLDDAMLNKIDAALLKVEGVKNTGWPDEHGDRVITFDVKKKTHYGDVLKAAKAIGVELENPKPAAKH